MTNPLEGFSKPQKNKYIFSHRVWFAISAVCFATAAVLIFVVVRA